jgi:hypothetical protein
MPDKNHDNREMRIMRIGSTAIVLLILGAMGINMWIVSAAIALLILGATGINMLVHHETSAATAETTQSPTEPPK